MSASVCGNKRRSFFDDLANNGGTSPPVTKRLRCSTSSPVRLSSVSPPRAVSTVFDHLRTAFPGVDAKVLERSLEECGNDLDCAIKSLKQQFFGFHYRDQLSGKGSDPNMEEGGGGTTENLSDPTDIPVHGSQWVELLVQEMGSATSIDDARARATSVLENLEKSISTRAATEAAKTFQKEYTTVKGQIEALVRDNTILKRAVSIQHERQKEHDDRNNELQYLKQTLSQYQEQLRKLEVQNYALQMQLKQAELRSSIPNHFNPDIF